MKRRVMGLVLCLALALSLLPFGAFAKDLGTYTLDLTGGTVTPDVTIGQAVSLTLAKAKDAGMINMTKGTSTSTSQVVFFDLDKDGTNDLDVRVTLKSAKPTKVEFKANSSASVYGDVPLAVPYTGSTSYYSKLLMKFPKKLDTLTAKITFNANGGTGTMAAVTVVKNKSYTLPDCTFTAPAGKEFDKWDLGAPGASVTITKDTVVTAQWKDKSTTPKAIDTIEITSINTDLKAGQKPVFEAKLSAESAAMATVKEEHWIDETVNRILSSDGTEWTVVEGHTYSYGITLAPKEGYVFTETTGLKYNGLNYPQSVIGSTLKAGGSGLELWDFAPDVNVYGEFLDKLEVDLTKGGTIVPAAEVLYNTFMAAIADGQVNYSTAGAVDLDRDGTTDFSFDKVSGVIKLQPTLSLTQDVTLTLSDEGINYATAKAFTPFAKVVEFKLAPPAKTYDLNLSSGKATLSGEDCQALISALQADDNSGLITLTKSGSEYTADLDKDGKNDIKVTVSGSDAAVETLETNSVAEKVTLNTPLYDLTLLAQSSVPYFSSLTVRFKAAEPAKNLGAFTVDLSKETSVTLTQPQYAAFQASMGGLNFTGVIKSVSDGDKVRYDLDKDGKYDIQAEKKGDGSAVFTVLETNSVTGQKTLTVSDAALAVINTAEKKEYYKDVTVKLPGGLVNPFKDVSESDIFYDAVMWAYYAEPQVTVGISATRFGPDTTVTRGQTVTFLWRAMGEPEPSTTKNPFVDVKESDYYYKAVLWAVEKNITVGVNATHFVPSQTCSTAHIITFLYRTLGIGDNGWYDVAGAWATGKGLLDGLDLKVDPKTPCPRADVVLFLYRALK